MGALSVAIATGGVRTGPLVPAIEVQHAPRAEIGPLGTKRVQRAEPYGCSAFSLGNLAEFDGGEVGFVPTPPRGWLCNTTRPERRRQTSGLKVGSHGVWHCVALVPCLASSVGMP